MDATANLREQLALSARIAAGDAQEGDAARLADLVEALDAWIRRGGSLPEPWRTIWPG